jgi:DNA-directed RNA polymerase specialized sigma24 family protein
MECHRCAHQAAILAGRYAGRSFKRTPCGKCKLKENSLYTMPFDEDREVKRGGIVEDVPFPDEADAYEGALSVSAMADALAGLLALSPETLRVVLRRLRGMRYRDIAKDDGVTLAAVELQHKRVLKACPALRVLFAKKMAKQEKRKVVGENGADNLENDLITVK